MPSDRRQRLLVLICAVVVGAWLGDSFVVTPLFRLWNDWSDTIDTRRQQLADAEQTIQSLPNLQGRWDEMKSRSLPQQMPAAEGQVLGAVSRWAGEHGLTVGSVKPRWIEDEREKDAKTAEFRVTANGSFPAIVRFLNALETDPMALRVGDVKITTRDPIKGSQLTLEVTFTGLVIPEEKS